MTAGFEQSTVIDRRDINRSVAPSLSRALQPARSLPMPLITVIVPTCDRPALLPRAVESVLAQAGVEVELLVIDTNRTTPPVEAAHRTAAWLGDPRVRVIRADARNAAQARNAGLDAARGAWISYLDDDDAYGAGKLRGQLNLAESTSAFLVLSGATFHLRGRRRVVQCDANEWTGDDLILRARWNTPLLFHRHPGPARFDERLSPGEDAEFAHRLLAHARAGAVPIYREPVVDIFPQPGPRVNANPEPMQAAAAQILALRPGFYSRQAERRFRLQTLLGEAKLRRQPARCASLALHLLYVSRGADWRAAANAMAVSTGLAPGRWVS